MKRKRFLSVLLALTMCVSVMMVSAGAADIKTPFETLVPDVNFRNAIVTSTGYEDLYTLDENALKAKLATFDGTLNASGKKKQDIQKITNAEGLQYLRGAFLVDLSHNKIEDWSFLDFPVAPGQDKNEWYEYKAGQNEDADNEYGDNVCWDLAGNPFTKLPANFGGKLVIKQPATTSSEYNEHFRPRVVARTAVGQNISGKFDISRCEVPDGSGGWKPVVAVNTNLLKPELLTLSPVENQVQLPYSGIIKSGVQVIGIGIDQDIHFETSDEYGTLTPGSQSFKYYIHPHFFVYDKVTFERNYSVTLTKVEQGNNTKVLAGAVYALYKDGVDTTRTFTTDSNGQFTVDTLEAGEYSLIEIDSPVGYKKDATPQNFSIGATFGGGVASVKTTIDEEQPDGHVIIKDGPVVGPFDNTVFISGLDFALGTNAEDWYIEHSSPDITLTSATDAKPVEVLYSALQVLKEGTTTEEADHTDSNVKKSFTTLSAAMSDINTEKNKNTIVGPVTIKIDQTGVNAINLTHENEKIPSPPPYDPGPSTPTVSVKGEKIWVDDNNSGNTRPASIKVELYRDGGDSPYRTATVSASNNWKYSFTGLAKYRTGNTPYTYTVKEADVPEGYTSAVDSAAGSTGSTVTTTITNTLTPPEKPPVTPEEPKEPGDPGDPQTPGEPPVTPPTDPGEPSVTPPGDPGVPPTTPPTTPPATPPTNPNLPQTGTVRDSAPALLCLALATALAGCAVILRSKRKNCD